MNLKRVKTTKDMHLSGIGIDAEWRDKTLAALTLTDSQGNLLRLVLENYAVGAFVQAPPEKKTVHVVSGIVRGIGVPVREEFDEAYEANSRRNELEQADVLDSVSVKTEEVERWSTKFRCVCSRVGKPSTWCLRT